MSRIHQGCTLLLVLCAVIMVFNPILAAGEGSCSADADCVPSSCCHASGCVSSNDQAAMKAKGDCAAQTCTASCDAFTLDCGGKCFCTELKSCGAMLNINGHSPPALGSTHPLYFGGGDSGAPQKKKKYTYGYTKVRR